MPIDEHARAYAERFRPQIEDYASGYSSYPKPGWEPSALQIGEGYSDWYATAEARDNELLAVIDWLEERYTSNSWYESKQ